MRIALVSSVMCALAFAACGDDTGSGGGGTSTSATGTGTSTKAATGATTSTASATTGTSGSTSTGAGADTWDNFAMGFMETYCWECHGAGDPLRDYTTLAGVQQESAEIRCGVTATSLADCSGFPPPNQFPIDNAAGDNPKPTVDERDRLVAWIEAGLP